MSNESPAEQIEKSVKEACDRLSIVFEKRGSFPNTITYYGDNTLKQLPLFDLSFDQILICLPVFVEMIGSRIGVVFWNLPAKENSPKAFCIAIYSLTSCLLRHQCP